MNRPAATESPAQASHAHAAPFTCATPHPHPPTAHPRPARRRRRRALQRVPVPLRRCQSLNRASQAKPSRGRVDDRARGVRVSVRDDLLCLGFSCTPLPRH
jgi:hypothetical protein